MEIRGIARWIMASFMIFLASLMAGLFYLSDRSQDKTEERLRLTFEAVSPLSVTELENCLRRPSGSGLALIQPRGGERGLLINNARSYRATLEDVPSGTAVRFYSRFNRPPRPLDMQNLKRCLAV